MLDTILTILGILGIILLVLLGTLLTIFLIVLFFPINYKAEGQKNEDAFWVKVKVNWLFRLIRVRFAYPEPGNVVVKALWFTLFDSKAEKKEKKTAGVSKTADSTSGENATEAKPESAGEQGTGEAAGTEADDAQGAAAGTADSTGTEADAAKGTVDHTGDNRESAVTDTAADGAFDKTEESIEPENVKKPGMIQKISEKIEKIKCKILNIYGKIKYIWENIKFCKELLLEEQTKALLRHLVLRVKKILWSIRPRKINADIVFGASSPDTTGYCMAVYGILSPILGKKVRFTPDFEQAVFKGEFSLKGHITLFTIVMHACIFLLDKKLRLLIAKVKKFYKKDFHDKNLHEKEFRKKEESGETAA